MTVMQPFLNRPRGPALGPVLLLVEVVAASRRFLGNSAARMPRNTFVLQVLVLLPPYLRSAATPTFPNRHLDQAIRTAPLQLKQRLEKLISKGLST
eukprot:UN04432